MQAYAQINRELRTQYILAFGTERPLTERELGSIRLRREQELDLHGRNA